MRESKLHLGHRKRLKDKIEKYGLESLTDHEVMEVTLYFGIPRKDVNELAHRLINNFGSVENVANANKTELLKFDGIGENAAFYLNFLGQLYKLYFQKRKHSSEICAKTAGELVDYFREEYGIHDQEELYLCFTDKNSNVVNFSKLEVGGIYGVSKNSNDIRKIIENSTEKNVILIHTHPNSSPKPSISDENATKIIMAFTSMAKKGFYDHIIISASEYYSFKEHGDLLNYELAVENIVNNLNSGNF